MRFEAVGGKVIVCDSKESFERIREVYFSGTPASHWKEKKLCSTSALTKQWKPGDEIPSDL
jgi:hypothetical protein